VALAGVGMAALAVPFVVGVMRGQSANGPSLKFEVASVRPTGEDATGSATKMPRGAGKGGDGARVEVAHRRIDFENINLFG
jgi:hypothetical protein